MKLLADVHTAPRTVDFLRALGHDVIRTPEVLPADAADEEIIRHAFDHGRVIVTQDLDFSALVALSGANRPSVPSPRLSSSRAEHVNEVLQRVLPDVEAPLHAGAIVSVEDERVRIRDLPIRF
jgi:predicted nuclease of predicted toxin-antitoxin system